MTAAHARPGLRQPAAAGASGADRPCARPRISPDIDETPAARRTAARMRRAWRARRQPRPPLPAATCWRPTPSSPPVGASCPRPRPKRRRGAACAAVGPAPPRDDRGRAACPGWTPRRAAGRDRGPLLAAERTPDRRLPRLRANGAARPAATPSRAAPRASSASSPAATPMSSACRCSRRRNCCAGWAGCCHDAAHSGRRQPGRGARRRAA